MVGNGRGGWRSMLNLGLVEALRYNKWANQRLLEACHDLTEQQLELRLAAGPIRELLLHLVGAQEDYVHWTQGRPHESTLTRTSAWPGIGHLVDLADRTSRELIMIAEELDPDSDVRLTHHGSVHVYPKRFLLTSVVEHGVRHRTEITLTLASMGISTPDLDGWAYGRAAGYGAEVDA
jgi:uncharacterized damage-inducible protein DinB